MDKNTLKTLVKIHLTEILDNSQEFNDKGFKLVPDESDDERRVYSYKVEYAPKLAQIRSKINSFKKEFEFYEMDNNMKIAEISKSIIKYLSDLSKLILGLDRLIQMLQKKNFY